MRPLLLLLPLAFCACSTPQYLHKGVQDGVEMAYRWNHPPGKPSELLLRLKNTTDGNRRVHLVIDLAYQGRTVETFLADTCMRAGRTMDGKLNGIYFIPAVLTAEQARSGDTDVEMTQVEIAPTTCE